MSNIYRYVTHEDKYNKFSFAFINLSKIDNHKGKNYKFDKKSAKIFVDEVGTQLITNQIKIISPDLIIGLNLADCGLDVFGNVYSCVPCNKDYTTFRLFKYLTMGGEEISFIDSRKHFHVFQKRIFVFLKEIVAAGLSMPHSSAFSEKKLKLMESNDE